MHGYMHVLVWCVCHEMLPQEEADLNRAWGTSTIAAKAQERAQEVLERQRIQAEAARKRAAKAQKAALLLTAGPKQQKGHAEGFVPEGKQGEGQDGEGAGEDGEASSSGEDGRC